MTRKTPQTNPPDHLSKQSAAWWLSVTTAYELDPHHLLLLTRACEALDRCQQARVAIAEHGMTFDDRFGQPHARPEVAIERDSRLAFARLVRELSLDDSDTPDTRPPAITGRYRSK